MDQMGQERMGRWCAPPRRLGVMKRYRVMPMDFDTRAWMFTEPIADHWTPDVKEVWREQRERNTRRGLVWEFGEADRERKEMDFCAIGRKPFSVLAFHNRFNSKSGRLRCWPYYPALTGACALGERILNHMVLAVRDEFKATPNFKRVYRKDSFDDWTVAIDALVNWDVLLPEAREPFGALQRTRNASLHFRPELDTNVREPAIEAIKELTTIIDVQFGISGKQPWIIPGTPGESYIKRDAEQLPFVSRVWLRHGSCVPVGPRHRLEPDSQGNWSVIRLPDYPQQEISDEEFWTQRAAALKASSATVASAEDA